METKVQFIDITQEKYDSLLAKNPGALYFTRDTKRLYKGDKEYTPLLTPVYEGSAKNATWRISGEISADVFGIEWVEYDAIEHINQFTITAQSPITVSEETITLDEDATSFTFQASDGTDTYEMSATRTDSPKAYKLGTQEGMLLATAEQGAKADQLAVDIEDKADKVSPESEGHLATFDETGNLADSKIEASSSSDGKNLSIGVAAKANGNKSTAIGLNAKVGTNGVEAIQLGDGENTTPKSLQFRGFQLAVETTVDDVTKCKIPNERLDVDDTLTQSGAPADAKEVGDEIALKYTKPDTGIPTGDIEDGAITKNKLSNDVKASLGKADTALQSSDIDNTLAIQDKAADAKAVGDAIGDLNTAISTKAETSDLNIVDGKVSDIQDLIPNGTTAKNQLAHQEFVNSSIATNTATYRGAFNLVDDLHLSVLATQEQISLALSTEIGDVADNNDYCFVQVPTSDEESTEIKQVDRYKLAVGVDTSTTPPTETKTWTYEYTLNNSGFTAAQWAAINSGITSGNVTKLNGIAAGAQVNVVETIKVNGTALTPDGNKAVDISVPQQASDIGAASSAQGTKADSAIQGVSVNGTELTKDANNKVNITNIPKAALASDVQTSLGKADSALQSSDPNVVMKNVDSINIGNSSLTGSGKRTPIAIGPGAQATKDASIAIGGKHWNNNTSTAQATGDGSIALGAGAQASATDSVQIGYSATANDTANSLRFRDTTIVDGTGKIPSSSLTLDTQPTSGGTNPITSGGVNTALEQIRSDMSNFLTEEDLSEVTVQDFTAEKIDVKDGGAIELGDDSSIKVTKGQNEATINVVDGETTHELTFPAKDGELVVDSDLINFVEKEQGSGKIPNTSLNIDDTLQVEGAPADAKAVGDALSTVMQGFPVYDGNNSSYLDDNTIDEADSTKTYKDTGTHVWTAQRKCLVYLNLSGTSNGGMVRVTINKDPDVDWGDSKTHIVCRIESMKDKCVCIPLFLNANDKVYLKVANAALSSAVFSVFSF